MKRYIKTNLDVNAVARVAEGHNGKSVAAKCSREHLNEMDHETDAARGELGSAVGT